MKNSISTRLSLVREILLIFPISNPFSRIGIPTLKPLADLKTLQ